MPPKRTKKMMTVPINVIFGHLQKKTRVKVWLYEDTKLQIEGTIIGFDEYMNIVLDEAVEVTKSSRTTVGRILLKGDAITLLQYVSYYLYPLLLSPSRTHSLTCLLLQRSPARASTRRRSNQLRQQITH